MPTTSPPRAVSSRNDWALLKGIRTVSAFGFCLTSMLHICGAIPSLSQNSACSASTGTGVLYRKWLDILSRAFCAFFPLGPTRLNLFQLLPRPLHFGHYLFDRRRPDKRSGDLNLRYDTSWNSCS